MSHANSNFIFPRNPNKPRLHLRPTPATALSPGSI
jgi:hypothetical protein